jgi:hypothetical protein
MASWHRAERGAGPCGFSESACGFHLTSSSRLAPAANPWRQFIERDAHAVDVLAQEFMPSAQDCIRLGVGPQATKSDEYLAMS